MPDVNTTPTAAHHKELLRRRTAPPLVRLPLDAGGQQPGLGIPRYHRSAVTAGVVHFGFGGFHRAHQAAYLHALMQRGDALQWGVVGVSVLPRDERMHDVMVAQGCEYVLIERGPDGSASAEVIGSVVAHLFAATDAEAVIEQLADPAIRIVSLTITESGYEQDTVTGGFAPRSAEVLADLHGSAPPRSTFGLMLAGIRRRRERGIAPFAVLSCDNIPDNGRVARNSMVGFASLIDLPTSEYIARHVAFPGTMVDRITPVTTDADRAEVRGRWGLDDAWPVACESFCQWVIEDDFPAGRPALERVGVKFVRDVAPYEEMKLRLLNAGHQALSQPAALLGVRYVHEAVRDPVLRAFLQGYLAEARPTVSRTIDVNLDNYCATLVARFGNEAIGDTIDRIVDDSDSRLAAFLIPPTRDNLREGRGTPFAALIFACAFLRITGHTAAPQRWRSIVQSSGAMADLARDDKFVDAVLAAIEQIRDRGLRAVITSLTSLAAAQPSEKVTEGEHGD